MLNSNFKKEKMSNLKFKRKKCRMFQLQSCSLKSFHIIRHFFLNNKQRKKCRTKRKKCRFLQNLYSIFLLNSKKRKKCRTKRKKCRLFKISIRHFFLNNKKRKKCRTIRHFCIRHFFIDSSKYTCLLSAGICLFLLG